MTRSRRRGTRAATGTWVEMLERRQMLCLVHAADFVELRPDLVGQQTQGGPDGGPAANIVWTNRGQSSDGFAVTFGANANTARAVMDAVIESFERMIGSFNYGDGSSNFNLTVNMSGFHNGASASLGATLGGKPKSGTITMGRGSGGTGGGWFIDPTPNEHSEFMGNIVNAFSGDAQAGSPASGLGDFYTVAAAEITHVLGLYGNSLSLWSSKTTNTGIPDTAEGGGRGTFYVFRSENIKHLLTSNNGGPGGSNWGSAVHAAGPGVNVSFQNDVYHGAQDIGNAVYEFSRRYIPNRTFSLMFKDAFSYDTVDPSKFGTFYSILNPTTGEVTVRGSTGIDRIAISVTGSTLYVSVDPVADVPGTGHLPGAGDLPAFVTEYDLAQVSTVTINAAEGNDIIDITSVPAGLTVTVNAGGGDDNMVIGGGDLFNNIVGTLTLNGQSGNDTITFDDSATNDNAEYTITSTGFTKTGFAPLGFSGAEAVALRANDQPNIIHVVSTVSDRPITVFAGGGDDTINVGSGLLSNLPALITIDGQGGNDTIHLNDSETALGELYFVNPANITRGGFGGLVFANTETVRLVADAANSAITVDGTDPAVNVILNGGAGGDLIAVNESAAAVTIESSAGNDSVSINSDGGGSAAVRFVSTVTHLQNLVIGGGGSATVDPAAQRVLVVHGTISIAGTGQLDLADNAMVVDYTGSSPLASVRNLLTAGYAGGAWNGAGGIISSVAAADATQKRALGYAEASALFSAFPASFANLEVDSTAVLVRHTIRGDANLDGTVNLADFNLLAAGFGTSGGWAQGNFNFDNTVNLTDFNLLAANFGQTVAPAASASIVAPPTSRTERDTDEDELI